MAAVGSPGQAINVAESGNCFYTALAAALTQRGKQQVEGLTPVLDALGVDSLSVRALRTRTPDFAAAYLGGSNDDFMKETFKTLNDVFRKCYATYVTLLDSLPQALAEKYADTPPESAEALTREWCACVLKYKTYACQIVVSSFEKALDELCGIQLRLIMASDTDCAKTMECDYVSGAATLIHVLDIEHYMWVGPKVEKNARSGSGKALGKRKRR